MRTVVSAAISVVATLGVPFGLGGCTILTSETFEQLAIDGRAPRGVKYSLPRGMVIATLTVDPASLVFGLDLTDGGVIPDPDHEYVLRYRQNPAYKDDIVVNTNDRGLLTSIETTTEDRTPAAIVNIAKALASFGGLEAASEAEKRVTLYTRAFDPMDGRQRRNVIDEANRRIAGYLAAELGACSLVGAEGSSIAAKHMAGLSDQKGKLGTTVAHLTQRKRIVDAAVDAQLKAAGPHITKVSQTACTNDVAPEVKTVCELLAEQSKVDDLLAKSRTSLTKVTTAYDTVEAQQKTRSPACQALPGMSKKPPTVHISLPDHPDEPAEASWSPTVQAQPGVAPPADCTIGACYRPMEAVKIVFGLDAGDETRIFDLPNRTDIVSIDIQRAFFIKKIQRMTFDRGMLTKLEIQKDSELLAVSLLPVTIVEEVAKSLQVRVKVKNAQVNVLEKEAALLNAQSTLLKAQAAAAGGGSGGGQESSLARPLRPSRTGATSRPVLP